MSSIEQGTGGTSGNIPGYCLFDLLQMEASSSWSWTENPLKLSPQTRLKSLLSEAGNGFCADCGSPHPKWVSFNIGAFICIKCSGMHRSLGVHISKVFSLKLDEWTNEQVDALIEMGGNNAVNLKYEANMPDNYSKPKPDASAEERADFIRRKYEMKQFMNNDLPELSCPLPPQLPNFSSSLQSAPEKKRYEKQFTYRFQSLGYAFHNSRRKPEHKPAKKSNSMAGMVEFVGLIHVTIVRGTNLAVRDMVSSDPYVILSLGNQSTKTRVIKNSLNPVWNEKLMLSIPQEIPPLKLYVYDKDTFSTDDFMGNADIDINPLLSAAKVSEGSSDNGPTQATANVETNKDTTIIREGEISVEDGRAKQEISIKLQNVERGVLEIEIECVLLTQ
ncbi:probable ADP-ribosylation factor GTPase-activating protein AGD11 [Andrographis paniculata]|uniref:probable ADP-ribosylation factor GTPase-activating protein AGD11 n=1 Tax=Andrographis paniculata TaxID=175694 RepID=UPI0021E77EB7|nr:probable ADP-ribosylation factor GTPase-activating protein AGD11 [Andrographis paniculata]XP_051123042.1 probable ADP-ribosylation factor GTPase-activating protein AGD11 [Andrographis paniculata]